MFQIINLAGSSGSNYPSPVRMARLHPFVIGLFLGGA